MNLVTLPTATKEEKLTIRQRASQIVADGSEHYDSEGDVILITLDESGNSMSINSTLGVLETVGLLEVVKQDTIGK